MNEYNQTFAEKIAESLEQLVKKHGIECSFDCGDFFITDFDADAIVRGKRKDILKNFEYLKQREWKARLRDHIPSHILSGFSCDGPFFIKYDFNKESTYLFGYKNFLNQNEGKFSNPQTIRSLFNNAPKFDATFRFLNDFNFPFYNVEEVVLLNNLEEGTRYSEKGEEKIILPNDFFKM